MKLSIYFIIGLLLASMVFAQSAPTPVIGHVKINGISPDGMLVEVRNEDNAEADVVTVEDLSSLRTERGVFLFDMNYFGRYDDGNPKYDGPSRRYAGDMLEFKVVGCPKCSYYFNVPRDYPYEFTITVDDPTVVVPVKEVIVENPVEVIKEVPVYVCSNGAVVDVKDNCPVESKEHADKTVIAIVISGGVAALGFAGLYLYYRKK